MRFHSSSLCAANLSFAIPTRVKTAPLNPLRASTLAFMMVAGGLLISHPHIAHAAQYVVTTDQDVTDATDGLTSLREAIDAANTAGGTNSITFDISGNSPHLINLATIGATNNGNSGLVINNNLSIVNDAAGDEPVTIRRDTGGDYRVLEIASGKTVTLAGITIANGNDTSGSGGGGILIGGNGNLTIRNSTISGNAAVFGAGMYLSGGTMTVQNSAILNNIGQLGGGLYASSGGPLTFTNCTIVGNQSTNGAGFGGGLNFNDNVVATLESCTITGNSALAGGGGVFSRGNAANSTTVSNSIISGNTSDSGDADVHYQFGTPENTFHSNGHNLIGTGNGATAFNQAGDTTGVSDPQLNAPADNGGLTQTASPKIGSPAIDKGDTSLTRDQRGILRPQRAADDIGAYELQNSAPTLNNATFSISLNDAFSQQLAGHDANGDTLSYKLAGGTSLPAGLTLGLRGGITGTPTTAGSTSFSVTVSDNYGGATTANFIIIVSSAPDGIGPIIGRNALASPTTRAALASSTLSGTIRDVAKSGVTPSGVSRLLVQLRDSAGQAYSGTKDGFTSNVNRGYFAATLGAPRGGTTSGARTYSRDLSWIPADLAPGDYTLNIAGQDVAGNYTVEVVPITIVAAAATSPVSAMRAPVAGGSGGAS